MVKTENFKQFQITSQEELREWLAANHSQHESIWLVTYKKNVLDKYVSTSEVLDELLCFGWIDGIRRKLDENLTMQLISPRKSQHWTNTYKKRYQKLLNENKVHESGKKSVAVSKKLGLWNYMDDVDQLIKPIDLSKEFRKFKEAEKNFDTFAPSAKRFILRWIKLSKTPTTRRKRIELVVKLASENKKIPGL
jgi:uncharacterized protein YdeI (YjbR/CyaY-like superfamily)